MTRHLAPVVERVLSALPDESRFTSRLRSPALTTRVGTWLGICFAIAFLTGLYSHLAQLPDPAVPLPTRPLWLYRLTQGLHVVAGTAAVPLLLVKLWSVFPKLFRRPPANLRRAALDGLERLSIAALVASAVFQLATGLANSAQWYPWGFSFRGTHFAVGWIAIGALVVHVAVKLPVIRDHWRTVPEVGPADHDQTAYPTTGLRRRTLLRATWTAVGVAVVTTAASGVPGLRHLSLLATRTGDGPAGIPINKTAAAAGVTDTASHPAYRLSVVNGARSVTLSRADLEAMPQVSATLPIACVEGWSASGRWTGVRVRDLATLVDGAGRAVLVESLQRSGGSRSSRLPPNVVGDPDTLLALALDGEPLSLDHGYPCRVIAPGRPGTLQTKWVARLEVEA
jgi:DMSO/TMAO reductase YedYZ molybdopterin-dependent catalytic subunit